jgi:hypothetical protein
VKIGSKAPLNLLAIQFCPKTPSQQEIRRQICREGITKVGAQILCLEDWTSLSVQGAVEKLTLGVASITKDSR